MLLCAAGHEEVCYEGRRCPVCEVISDSAARISELENDASGYRIEISDLQAEISSLEMAQGGA